MLHQERPIIEKNEGYQLSFFEKLLTTRKKNQKSLKTTQHLELLLVTLWKVTTVKTIMIVEIHEINLNFLFHKL